MFFSVKEPMRIGGKSYRTCICYVVTDTLKATIERLSEKGKVDIYSEQRFFCNGKLVEKKAVVKENATTEKKEKKNKKAQKVEVVEEQEEIKEEDF